MEKFHHLVNCRFAAPAGENNVRARTAPDNKSKYMCMWKQNACVIPSNDQVCLSQIPLVAVDSYFYGKLVIAPLNILLYNVFTPHGPDLYGKFCSPLMD